MPRLGLVLLVSLALAACGGDDPAADDPTTPDDQSTTSAPASDPATGETPSEAASSPAQSDVEDPTAEFTVTLTGGEYEGTYEVATNQVTGCTVGILEEGTFFAQFGGTEGEDPVVYIDVSVPDWETVRGSGTTTTFASSIKFAPANMPHAMVDTVPGSAFAGGSGTVTISEDGGLTTVAVDATTADDVGYDVTVVCHSIM